MSLLFRQKRVLALAGLACRLTGLLPFCVPLGGAPPADAGGCSFEPSPADPRAPFTRHLPQACTPDERGRLAVRAEDLLHALTEGRGVDLAGVVVTGDLLLDQLPLVPSDAAVLPPGRLKDVLQSQHLTTVRVIGGPILLRDCQVRGRIASNLQEGLLVVRGPVTMAGTTFERSVDFSRTAFLAPVSFSDSILLREAYFIQTLFTRPVTFERTAFGVHSRFHQAMFADTATFLRAGFNGLSEFLEVSFEKDTSFSRTYFKLGTGFSGSRFHGGLDFSEATFEREAFFLFTVFGGDTYFRRATFRAAADFSDAEFRGLEDFSKVLFEVEPSFARTKSNPNRRSLGGLQDPKVLYVIGAALLIFTLGFILVLRKT
jgi:hypothetical protein